MTPLPKSPSIEKSAEPILEVEELSKSFRTPSGMLQAVSYASFAIHAGETVGLVGESGCGKSTLGKTVFRLHQPDTGTIRLKGTDITSLGRRALRPSRREMQMVFQDPYASLNPRKTVRRILETPLLVQGIGPASERSDRVVAVLEKVGLSPDVLSRYPHEFSGGQRQRIGVARALVLRPELVICDEPVSALDVSVQAQVINLLGELRREFNLAYLFVSHDLSVVAHLADRVMVMYLGRIVEVSSRTEIWRRPLHPYVQALISAVPEPAPRSTGSRFVLQGEIPSPVNPPSGCGFRTRCPFAELRCSTERPRLRQVGNAGRAVACHLITQALDGNVSGPSLSELKPKGFV